ncbi:hypothetical protein WN982_10365 [Paraburkholderia sp. IMGN_8]|uniref:hypothetical protein n=1 Tax=Paraburkholderia sp. IMGN_8 TaxID=3136564 RepID=UPI003100B06B
MTDAPSSQRPSPAQRVATLHTIAAAVSLLDRQGIDAGVLLATANTVPWRVDPEHRIHITNLPGGFEQEAF